MTSYRLEYFKFNTNYDDDKNKLYEDIILSDEELNGIIIISFIIFPDKNPCNFYEIDHEGDEFIKIDLDYFLDNCENIDDDDNSDIDNNDESYIYKAIIGNSDNLIYVKFNNDNFIKAIIYFCNLVNINYLNYIHNIKKNKNYNINFINLV